MGRVEEIRQRAMVATEGPWHCHDFGNPGEQEPSSIMIHAGRFNWEDINKGEFIAATPLWNLQVSNNARFIAYAREDVEYLIDELDAKDSEIARLRSYIAEGK